MSAFTPGFGASDAFDALVYGETHPGTIAFLANQVNNVADTLTDAGRAFMSKTRDLFERFNGTAAMRFAREVVNSVKGAGARPDRIMTLWELPEMQSASLTMQRWIMANPNVRRRYHVQKCDGYSDTYIDVEPGQVGEDHYDWRRVMDGHFVFDEEGHWKCVQYFEDLKEGDRHLLHEEQVDIQRSWEAMDLVLALCKDDPTSPVGGSL